MEEAETLFLVGPPAVWRRACTACTEAKRKCSKQTPTCHRCNQRGLQCLYPPARALEGYPHPPGGTASYHGAFPPPSADGSVPVSEPARCLAKSPITSADVLFLGLQSALEPVQSRSAHWFLAHDSWEIAHHPPQAKPELFGEETLSAYVAIVQKWLRKWVETDHCPFIHRYLYRVHMPRRVQDVYATISVYLHKTPATEATVRRIIEHRLHELLEEDTVDSALELGFPTLVDHLARVQALLVLLVICLFDGNIRLRAQGELHLATLLFWNDQMWQQATQAMQRGATLEPWRLWTFGESLRRTWLTASIINSVYTNMTQGYSWCPGGVYCTFGNQLWNATTSHDWERGSDPGRKPFFMQSLDVNELLVKEDPEAVDDFGHAIMLISLGVDKVEQWTASKGAPTAC